MSPRRRQARWIADWWNDYGWFLWAGCALLVVILGYIGFQQHFDGQGNKSVADLLYRSLQLFALESGAVGPPIPWELQAARIAAPALAAVGIIGAVRALVHALRERGWRISRANHHTIICGLGRRGSALTGALRNAGELVVVIENGADPNRIDTCREAGALVLNGDATDDELLRRARVGRARHLVALCGDDGVNAQVGVLARELAVEAGAKTDIVVNIFDRELAHAIEERGAAVPLRVINVFDKATDRMLDKDKCFPDEYGEGERLVVAGVGQLGQSLILRAAEHWREAGRSDRLPITVLDRAAQKKVHQLSVDVPELVGHCQLEPWEEDLAGPEFDTGRCLPTSAWRSVRAAYVCVDNDPLALTCALTLQQHAPDSASIIVRMSAQDRGLATLLPDTPRIRAFGIDQVCTPEILGLGRDP
jgi:voltage-gated potassium channel Kch